MQGEPGQPGRLGPFPRIYRPQRYKCSVTSVVHGQLGTIAAGVAKARPDRGDFVGMGYAGVARTGPTKSGMGIAGGCIDRANPLDCGLVVAPG